MVLASRPLFMLYFKFLEGWISVANGHLFHISTSVDKLISFFIKFSNEIPIRRNVGDIINSRLASFSCTFLPARPGFILTLPAPPRPGKSAPRPVSVSGLFVTIKWIAGRCAQYFDIFSTTTGLFVLGNVSFDRKVFGLQFYSILINKYILGKKNFSRSQILKRLRYNFSSKWHCFEVITGSIRDIGMILLLAIHLTKIHLLT